MKREIIFRGKRIDTGEWVYGWYCKESFGRWPLKDCIIPAQQAEEGWIQHIKIDPDTVGQFTGMTDKNGVKIFEGDILRTKYGRLCVVEWFESNLFLCFDLKPISAAENLHKHAPDKFDLWYKENLEVISNIHDTPELLEAKR